MYRLTVTLADNRVLTEFTFDSLSELAWVDNNGANNIFNSYGYHRPNTVRHVSITGSEPPTRARAAWYRRYRS